MQSKISSLFLATLVCFSIAGSSAWGLAPHCRSLFRANPYLEAATLSKVDQWVAQDQEKNVSEQNRRFVHLVKDSSGQAIKTRVSVLIVHGLYNSPKEMNEIALFYESQGLNVINSRLDGHHEADTEIIKNKVEWQTWLADTKNDLQLARELGEKVLVIGHSTGALAEAWAAVDNPTNLAGLMMFSPAFHVQPMTAGSAWFSEKVHLDFTLPDGRYITGRAGVQVSAMAQAFQDWLAEMSEENKAPYAAAQLSRIPILMANTKFDFVISPEAAQNFMNAATGPDTDPALRMSHDAPFSQGVAHSAMSTSKNPNFGYLLDASVGFFGLDQGRD